jgi:hypothetical protein
MRSLRRKRWIIQGVGLLLGLILMPGYSQSQGMPKARPIKKKESARRSHVPLGQDPGNLDSPEDLLAERLFKTRDLNSLLNHKGVNGVPPDVKQFVSKLLEDPAFLAEMKKHYGKDIAQLQKDFSQGKGFKNSKLFKEILEKGLAGKKLSQNEAGRIDQWLNRQGGQDTNGGSSSNEPEQQPRVPDWLERAKDDKETGSAFERWQASGTEWLNENMGKWLNSLDKYVDSPAGKNWRDALGRVTRAYSENRFSAGGLSGRASRVPSWVTGLTGKLSHSMRSNAREARYTLPNRFGGSFRPSAPSGNDTIKFLLLTLSAGVLLLVVFQLRQWARRRAEGLSVWKLGPWPVQPGAVKTRSDLVKAFEHLALLCLGQSARTCHHLDLAEKLGKNPSLDPVGNADAAKHLAHLYEVARYAPGTEPLSELEVNRARRELCLLAGVAAP